jgi:hypothetical protein
MAQRAQRAQRVEQAALKQAAVAMASTIVRPITPPPTAPVPAAATTPAPTTPTTVPAAAAAPVPAPAPAAAAAAPVATPAPSDPTVVPPVGQATAWGCDAALAYLQAYAAQGFTFECPGYAEGREAMTCVNLAGICPGASLIAISDACPQAYMNEASNSYVVTGASDAPIDPFGPCP